MNLSDIIEEVRSIKKQAFVPAPPPQGPAAAPQGAGAPPPGAGAPPPGAGAPAAGAAPAPAGPAGGQSILALLQQNGIDPNQLLQDPNFLNQVAQQAGMPPEQLAQMVQAEMQQGGAGAPTADPAAAGQAGPDPIQELYGAVEQIGGAMGEVQQVLPEVQERMANIEGQLQALASSVDKLNALADETPGMPENVR